MGTTQELVQQLGLPEHVQWHPDFVQKLAHQKNLSQEIESIEAYTPHSELMQHFVNIMEGSQNIFAYKLPEERSLEFLQALNYTNIDTIPDPTRVAQIEIEAGKADALLTPEALKQHGQVIDAVEETLDKLVGNRTRTWEPNTQSIEDAYLEISQNVDESTTGILLLIDWVKEKYDPETKAQFNPDLPRTFQAFGKDVVFNFDTVEGPVLELAKNIQVTSEFDQLDILAQTISDAKEELDFSQDSANVMRVLREMQNEKVFTQEVTAPEPVMTSGGSEEAAQKSSAGEIRRSRRERKQEEQGYKYGAAEVVVIGEGTNNRHLLLNFIHNAGNETPIRRDELSQEVLAALDIVMPELVKRIETVKAYDYIETTVSKNSIQVIAYPKDPKKARIIENFPLG